MGAMRVWARFARSLFVPVRSSAAVLATGYVVTVGTLGALAFSEEAASPPMIELLAFVLLLPTLPVVLPVIYVVGSWAWNARASLPGEPMWPVTVTFGVLFAAAAIANVLVVWAAVSWRRRRRTGTQVVVPPLRMSRPVA